MPDERRTARPSGPARSESLQESGTRPPGPGLPARPAALLHVGLFVAALNLRPAVSSLGALLQEVRDGFQMSGTLAGLLTSAPPLCFAVFGATAPRLARRFGPGAVILAGLVAITGGLAVRPYVPWTAAFVAASCLALGGIAVGNVLMPVVVKRYFPDRIGTMTGLYSLAVSLGTALAAATAVPVAGAVGGWRNGLAAWALLGALAVVPWFGLVRDRSRLAGGPPPGVPETAAAPGPPSLVRSPTAWALAVFFGLQASGAYMTMGWMSQRFRDAGVAAGTAGLLLAVIMVMGVPLAFVIPRLATRLRHQGPLVAALAVCGLVAFAGLYAYPVGGAWAWAVLLGISNCSFPLALTMIGMRSGSAAGVVRLSAFAQSTGYLISVPGPLLVGVLYQHTGGWGAPLALMAGLLLPQTAVGLVAGRDRTIEQEAGMRD